VETPTLVVVLITDQEITEIPIPRAELITETEITEILREDRVRDITLPADPQGRPFIPIVRAIFINGHSQTATGNKDKTEHGHP